MGEMICVCREIDKYTGEIAVYPNKAEVTDRLLFCLGLRQRANPILKQLCRKQITDRLLAVLNLVQL